MKRLLSNFTMLLLSIFFLNNAIAQNKPVACQTEETVGLNWQNGRWQVTRFNVKKFILVQAGNLLTTESAGKAIDSPASLVTCKNEAPQISCSGVSGEYLYYDTLNRSGGIARIFGGTMKRPDYRDSVTVSVFTCESF